MVKLKKITSSSDSPGMVRIVKSSMEEVKNMKESDEYDIHLIVLKKQNDFFKLHLKKLNDLIDEYISTSGGKQKHKKLRKNVIDLSKNKQERMSNLLSRQLNTSERRIRLLSTERKKIVAKISKYEQPGYMDNLEQHLLDLNEGIVIQKDKINWKRQQDIKLMNNVIEKRHTKNSRFQSHLREHSPSNFYYNEDMRTVKLRGSSRNYNSSERQRSRYENRLFDSDNQEGKFPIISCRFYKSKH